MKVREEVLVANYTKYKRGLDSVLGEEKADKLIEYLGGADKVMRSTYAMQDDSGLAFDGSLIKAILTATSYAMKINGFLPETKQVPIEKLTKVCLLNNISKVLMFEPNDSEWEIQKRGLKYKFTDKETALRMCERSILICMQNGIVLEEDEYEAMRILDKTDSNDNYSAVFSTMLSTVVREAYILVNNVYSEKK